MRSVGYLLWWVWLGAGHASRDLPAESLVVCLCRSQRPKRSKAASVSPAQAGSLTRDVSMLRELWQSGWHAAWRTVPMLLCSACTHMGRCHIRKMIFEKADPILRLRFKWSSSCS